MKRLSSTRRRLAPIPPILTSSSARLSVTVISGPLGGVGGSVARGGGGVGYGVRARLDQWFAALLRGRPQDGLDDVLVAGAATQVARQTEPDLVLGRVGVRVQQRTRGHHHPRRAEAALEPVLLLEALLHRVELAGGPEALD